MDRTPVVSIVTPAYKTADVIGETLDSIRRQSFTDWEAVIIDDGSPDAMGDAVAPFLADPRYRYLRQPNAGPTAARNHGIAEARGRYVSFLDSDDLMEPDYLDSMVGALEADPGAVIACCDATMFGLPTREGRRLSEFEPMDGPPTLLNVLSRRFLIYTGCTVRTASLREVGGYAPEMPPAAEDFDLWVRLLMRCGHAVYLGRPLARYRRRAGSLSNTPTAMQIGLSMAYLRALRALPVTSPEAAACRRVLARTVGEMEQYAAEQHLMEGRGAAASAPLARAAKLGALGPRWQLLRPLTVIAPGLAAQIVQRLAARLDPLKRNRLPASPNQA